MRFLLCGSINGRLEVLYRLLDKIKKDLADDPPSWVLCPGSLGFWPDPSRQDKAAKVHGAADYPKILASGVFSPIPIVFVAGSSEDHFLLHRRRARADLEVLPGVHCLWDGFRTFIGNEKEQLRVVGLGRSFSPRSYVGGRSKKSLGHYTRVDVERACGHEHTDILLCHEGPRGQQFGTKRSNAQGILDIIKATTPKLIVHSHYNFSQRYTLGGAQFVSLGDMELQVWEKEGEKFEMVRSF